MIVSSDKDALRYLGISPNLDSALRMIQEGRYIAAPGHYDVDGDNLWMNCFDYETLPESSTTYEAHERYGDVHILQSGCEKVYVSEPSRLKVLQRKEEDDYIELVGDAQYEILLKPGIFLVVFPEDAHRIKMQVNGPEQVRKSVFKFKL